MNKLFSKTMKSELFLMIYLVSLFLIFSGCGNDNVTSDAPLAIKYKSQLIEAVHCTKDDAIDKSKDITALIVPAKSQIEVMFKSQPTSIDYSIINEQNIDFDLYNHGIVAPEQKGKYVFLVSGNYGSYKDDYVFNLTVE